MDERESSKSEKAPPFGGAFCLVDPKGFEPSTSRMRTNEKL